MTEIKRYWIKQQCHTYRVRDMLNEHRFKGYRFGFVGTGENKRNYVVTNESAELVIEKLRSIGLTVTEITNHD